MTDNPTERAALFLTRHGAGRQFVGFINGGEVAAKAWCKKGNAFFVAGWPFLTKWSGDKQPPSFSFELGADLSDGAP